MYVSYTKNIDKTRVNSIVEKMDHITSEDVLSFYNVGRSTTKIMIDATREASIKELIERTSCTKNQAIDVLTKTNDNYRKAISLLTDKK